MNYLPAKRQAYSSNEYPNEDKGRGCNHDSPFRIATWFVVRTNPAMGLRIQQNRYSKSCEPTRTARFASADGCRAIASTLNPLLQISR